MQYRVLGRTGVKVSPLCLGGDNFVNPTSEQESIQLIQRALEGGINFIDTSNSYMQGESEHVIGAALKASGRRHQTIIATKAHYAVGPGPNDRGNSRLHVIRACEDSLRRLGTDYIDLYQTHRPDFDVPLDETLGALTDLVRAGKVRYIGSSTALAWHVMEALMVSEREGLARFVSEQPPYNLLDRRIENELIPLCESHDLAILPWSPVAGGMLTGRYSPDARKPEGSRADRWGARFETRVPTGAWRSRRKLHVWRRSAI